MAHVRSAVHDTQASATATAIATIKDQITITV